MSDITFWSIYRQSLIVGQYAVFRDLVRRALAQGISRREIEAACDLALITNLVIPFVLVAPIVILIRWLSV